MRHADTSDVTPPRHTDTSDMTGPRHTDTCLTTQLCRLQTLAQSSQWKQVMDTLKDVETSQCIEGVLERAMTEGQWDCVVRLVGHCSVQQRERAVQRAATRDQWSSVAEMVGVGSAVRSRLLKLAVAARQSGCEAVLVSVGGCGQCKVKDSLTQAVDSVGVCGQCKVKDSLTQTVGVCGQYKVKDSLTQAVDSVGVCGQQRDSVGVCGQCKDSLTQAVDSVGVCGQCKDSLTQAVDSVGVCGQCTVKDSLTQAVDSVGVCGQCTVKDSLTQAVDNVEVCGQCKDSLTQAVDSVGMCGQCKDSLTQAVDSVGVCGQCKDSLTQAVDSVGVCGQCKDSLTQAVDSVGVCGQCTVKDSLTQAVDSVGVCGQCKVKDSLTQAVDSVGVCGQCKVKDSLTQAVDSVGGCGQCKVKDSLTQAVDSVGVRGQYKVKDSLTEVVDSVGVCGQQRDSVGVCGQQRDSVGVCGQHRDDSRTQAVDSGQCDFVLELKAACADRDVIDFVRRQAVMKERWPRVWGLVTQGHWPLVQSMVTKGLDAGQLESLCDHAVGSGQWDLVITLLQQGVNTNEQVVSELCQRHMAQLLLDGVPAGSLTSRLTGLLLTAGVRHGQGDITLQVIQREKVCDAQLMAAMKYAVHLRDQDVFTKLVTQSPRCRRVFKQRCHQQDWTCSGPCGYLATGDAGDVSEMGGEICWMYATLHIAGEHHLARYVATAKRIGDTWRNNADFFDLGKRKTRRMLMNDYEEEGEEFQELVLEKYKRSEADRSFLFRLAIRLEEFLLATTLCGYGVQRSDLKFAVPWLMMTQDTKALSSFSLQLEEGDRAWFEQCIAQYAMKEYFKEKSESKLTAFIDRFKSCQDKTMGSQLFRAAVAKAVKHDDVECFVKVCCSHVESQTLSDDSESREDFRFAYSKAVGAGRKHFIKQVCQTRLAESESSLAEITVLEEVVFEAKAWDVLPCLCDGMACLLIEKDCPEPLRWFLHKMLQDEEIWEGVAPGLEQWLKEPSFGSFQCLVQVVGNLASRHHCALSLSSLERWCMDQCHYRLAVVLAFGLKDWELVETVVNVEGLDCDEYLLYAAVELTADWEVFSLGATMLKTCPLNTDNVGFLIIPYRIRNAKQLGMACEELGLEDWALILSHPYMESDCVIERTRRCHNQVVLDQVLVESADRARGKIVQELLPGCFNSSLLTFVLTAAISRGSVKSAEAVIDRVDSSSIIDDEDKTLFRLAARNICDEKRRVMKLLNLCITSGLSTFERDVSCQEFIPEKYIRCPLLYALLLNRVWLVQLLLRCGAYTHKQLHDIRQDYKIPQLLRLGLLQDRQRQLNEGPFDAYCEEGYRCIMAAASTPFRLEHAARLEVSHLIGCRPGRAERIESLEVPQPVKDLVRFRDMVHSEDRDDSDSEDCDGDYLLK